MSKAEMIIAVVGSRDFKDYDAMCAVLGVCSFTGIVSGGARGADRLAERYAVEHGVEITVCPAEWDKYPGKTAAYERNRLMVEMADAVVAFWNGKSKGTRMAMLLCREAGKPVMVVRTDMLGESDG